MEPIAIIGLGCRFPGADGPRAFWRLLRDGVDAIREVPHDRWDLDPSHRATGRGPGKLTTLSGGFLRQIDGFDAAFFEISPREARRIDPHQRLLLQTAWEAARGRRHAPRSACRKTGGCVFVGFGGPDYLLEQAFRLRSKWMSTR